MTPGDDTNSAQAQARLERLQSELDESRRELEATRERAERNDAAVSELRRSQELSRRLIEAMPGGVVHVGTDGAIRTANAEALRILGLSYDEIAKRYTVDFETQTISEDGEPCPAEDYPVSLALATGDPQPAQTIGVQRPDGTVAWAVFTAVPIKEADGTTIGAVVTFLDITRRKALEERLREAQKMEAIGRLAGGIAHDFNNLLTVVLANASDLRSSHLLDDTYMTDVEQIIEAGRGAAQLTSQLLSFARRQIIAPSNTALDALVRKTVTLLTRLVGDGIELRVTSAPKLWSVFVDANQLEQVIINLVLNARDAVVGGGVITIETENGHGENGEEQVLLRVHDDGPGIDPDAIEHIFEPFFTTKDSGQGTGLGLATCYGIVTQAGGTIAAWSRPAFGSTFEVRLPRAPVDAPMQQESESIEPTQPAPTAVILVVEDEPVVRRIVARILGREGHRLLVADSGASALALLEGERVLDLVLADVMMPGMLGPEVVRRVRELFPNVATLYMSGLADHALNDRGILQSPMQLLRKPFEAASLLSRVRSILREQRPAKHD